MNDAFFIPNTISHLKFNMARIRFSLYALHDWMCEILRRYYRHSKIALLFVAHATLLGFLVPELRRDFGEQARNVLIFLLFISPLSKIFPIAIFQLLMGLRRQFGILFAYLAIVHGVGYLMDPDWANYIFWPLFSDPSSVPLRYPLGIVALILTLPLLITSNTLSMRLMKSKWKTLHRLVYTVLVFSLFHAFLRDTASLDRAGVAQAVFILGVYLGLKSLSFMPNLSLLVRLRSFVSMDYARYDEGRKARM